jgi:hypothetical protein
VNSAPGRPKLNSHPLGGQRSEEAVNSAPGRPKLNSHPLGGQRSEEAVNSAPGRPKLNSHPLGGQRSEGAMLYSRPNAWTFQASQNLRSGVRLTRFVSTSNGSAAISCSSVR